jgi:hypothetical protein
MSDLALSLAEQAGREQRQFPRYLTLATARIVAESTIDCAVLNISKGGACLLVADPAVVPRHFELVVDPGRLRVRCHLAWRSRHRIGVAFMANGDEPLPIPQAWPTVMSCDEA